MVSSHDTTTRNNNRKLKIKKIFTFAVTLIFYLVYLSNFCLLVFGLIFVHRPTSLIEFLIIMIIVITPFLGELIGELIFADDINDNVGMLIASVLSSTLLLILLY